MKTRGVLMNGEMVRALLDGSKTQTRRPCTVPWKNGKRCQPYEPYWVVEEGKLFGADEYGDFHEHFGSLGKVGDRLYVRETFWQWGRYVKLATKTKTGRFEETFEPITPPETFIGVLYAHAGTTVYKPDSRYHVGYHKRPSIFMPKKLARIWLEITGVSVERVQDISLDDILAEGVEIGGTYGEGHLREKWRQLIRSLYPGAWERNDWVFKDEFKRIEVKE